MDAKKVYLSKPWLKYYPKDVPATVAIPDLSVPELIDQAVDKYKKNTAVIFYGKKISYAELKELIDRFATALAALGIKRGDTVALFLLNCPQYIIAYFAILKLGAKVTPISPVYTSMEVKHQLEDSEAQAIVCQDILYDNVEKTGVALKRVILTSIGEYLPTLKKMVMKSALAKAYGEMQVPTPKFIKEEGL
ncbi:MAG TPA: AMP-binding protein, partial [Thermodesulfobacteriota bacterium]